MVTGTVRGQVIVVLLEDDDILNDGLLPAGSYFSR